MTKLKAVLEKIIKTVKQISEEKIAEVTFEFLIFMNAFNKNNSNIFIPSENIKLKSSLTENTLINEIAITLN
jgi:hypothetical protein